MKRKFMGFVAIAACSTMLLSACGTAGNNESSNGSAKSSSASVTEESTETESTETGTEEGSESETKASSKTAYLAFDSAAMSVIDGTLSWNDDDKTWEAKYPSPYGDVSITGTYDEDGIMTAEADNMDGHAMEDTEILGLIQASFTNNLAGKFSAPLAFTSGIGEVKGGLITWDENTKEFDAMFTTPLGATEVSGTFDDDGVLTGVEDNMEGNALASVTEFQDVFTDARNGIFVSAAVEEVAEDNELSEAIEAYETDNTWKNAVADIARTYDPEVRNNDIIFYGASNFARWSSMEDDLMPYDVQNHAFGGSTDKDLLTWAEFMLYEYTPKYVFFQTGSNDYIESTAPTDEEKVAEAMEFKKEMFATFHENMPDAKFVVMSGILLPGRPEYVDMTLQINDQLKEFCEDTDYMIYVDAESLTYDRSTNSFVDGVEDLFVEDQIHLTDEARITWAQNWMLPLMEELDMPVHE